MKIAFVILCDKELHNYARKLSLDIENKYKTGLLGSTLPPHITLKQPFDVKDMEQLAKIEKYFDNFASGVNPFVLKFNKIGLFDTGVIFIDLEQDHKLMGMHLDLLTGLKNNFDVEPGMFEEKDKYHFHCTLAVWGKDLNVYKDIFQEYKKLKIDYQFKFTQLGMFVYTDNNFGPSSFFDYKIIDIK